MNFERTADKIEDAPLSQNPACNPICRACHYKDLSYSIQIERKRKWAETQLSNWKNQLHEIIPASEGDRLAYRSKSWMKAFVHEGQVSFGMYRSIQAQGKWDQEFISWDTCPLHTEAIQQMIPKMRHSLAQKASRFLEESLVGIWLGSPHCVIVSRKFDFEAVKKLDWDKILQPPFNQVWFHCNPQVGKKIFGHHEIQKVFGESVDSIHPIRAFRQVAQSLLVQARALAVQHLLQYQPSLILDFYCGTGELSLLLPPTVGWIGIEFSSEAVKYAQQLKHRLGRQPNPDFVEHTAFVGGVEQRLSDPNVLKKIKEPYAMFLNPPRSGLTYEAQEKILAVMKDKPPTSVVYLSCSASSLARDLRAFEQENYRVELLQPYDFFPQTEHFETLAVLRKVENSGT